MEVPQKTLHDYNPVTKPNNDFKAYLKVYVNREPELSNIDCINSPQEDLTAELLFCKEMICDPTILFRVLKDYLVLK